MTEAQPPGRHVTDEDLLLDFYDESSAADREERQRHLEACEACRALDREMRAVLAMVDSTPPVEAPPGFGREMWARLEPQISARMSRERPSWFFPRRFALAGGMAVLLVAAFALGRVWDSSPTRVEERALDPGTVRERLLQSEVEDHFERSERVLVDLVNADDVTTASLDDRSRAADLVAAGRLYRRSAERIGDVEMRDLLEDVERILVDVANGPDEGASKDLTDVRTRISEQDLVFRLRLAASDMRERERRTRPTW